MDIDNGPSLYNLVIDGNPSTLEDIAKILQHSFPDLSIDWRPKPVSYFRGDYDGLVIDERSGKASLDGNGLNISPINFSVLLYLAQNPDTSLTNRQIQLKVWGVRDNSKRTSVSTAIRSLCESLGETINGPRYISSRRARGDCIYTFNSKPITQREAKADSTSFAAD